MKTYYDHAGITIYHGDCREVLPRLDARAFSLALTSPPYDDARAYAGLTKDDLEKIGLEFIRLLKPGGVAAWIIDGPVNDRARSTTPFEMICRWSAQPGWRFLECLIYGRLGAPGAYSGRFRKDHEYMPVFVRDGAEHACDKRSLARKSTCKEWQGAKARNRKRDGTIYERASSGWAVENKMTLPGTVWEYGRDVVGYGHDDSYFYDHPAVFPERLARDLIKCFSRPGDLIIEPCLGSGTTLRAAKDLGRRAIGIEIDERYCEIAARRLAQNVLDFSGGGAA